MHKSPVIAIFDIETIGAVVGVFTNNNGEEAVTLKRQSQNNRINSTSLPLSVKTPTTAECFLLIDRRPKNLLACINLLS
ncbi:MAG: hypothetical protein H7122_09705 [Chitinophagaceae bacterium]|nr:hypothetical protein [Chitinophagaceae bacterium]